MFGISVVKERFFLSRFYYTLFFPFCKHYPKFFVQGKKMGYNFVHANEKNNRKDLC